MDLDFDKYKLLQYCTNEWCKYHNQIGLGNICTLSSKNNQVYCNGCKSRWVITKDTFFYDLRSEKALIISVLKDLSEGKGPSSEPRVCAWRPKGAGCQGQRTTFLKSANIWKETCTLIGCRSTNFGVLFLKKENLTSEEHQAHSEHTGDRWTFVGVLPESSYIHTVHSGQRNQEQAKVFVEHIKGNSDGRAPFFESDGWFYEEVLTDVYGTWQEVPYKGIGRKPFPRQMPDPELRYAQVVKEWKSSQDHHAHRVGG